ncbi:MAG: hypothetical protein KAG97_12180, partial [Victivallales bacterium]|nr:hypothetical protein [Victivallales bacterium]
EFPNVIGAVCDDVAVDYEQIILPEKFEERYVALKKYNDQLRMYGVIYTHEFGRKDFSRVVDFFDVVNLWFWNKEYILNFDENIALCRANFPGKPILLGVFLHDYGRSDAGTPPDLLTFQLDKAREYIEKNIIEGVVILGDREIKKWPASAAAVKNYLDNQ